MTDLKKLWSEAGIKPGTLYAEGGSILIDDRYLYDIGHGEAEQGGDLHEVASMLPIMAELFVAAVNAVPELLALREEVGRLREALRLGKVVMDLLDKHGPSIVPHLLDTDENAGQRFRDALNQEPGQ